jgi:antitoxin HicB
MTELFKIPLVLMPQPEGGYTITSPIVPELLTEGETLEEAMANLQDAFAAVMELYQDLGKSFPTNAIQEATATPIWFDCLVPA